MYQRMEVLVGHDESCGHWRGQVIVFFADFTTEEIETNCYDTKEKAHRAALLLGERVRQEFEGSQEDILH